MSDRRIVTGARMSSPKKQMLFAKLLKAGIGLEQCQALLDATEAEMKQLTEVWPTFKPSYVFDAVHLLGFGEADTQPLPKLAPGEIVIRYGGWSWQELIDSKTCGRFMHSTRRYNGCRWSTEKLPSGTYHLRIPVHNSNNKTFKQQMPLLLENEQIAPAVLVASAILSHYLQKGKNLLKGEWVRCKEEAYDGDRIVLYWHEEHLVAVYHTCGDDYTVSLSAIRIP